MDSNVLLIETDSEIITIFTPVLGGYVEIDRKPRSKDEIGLWKTVHHHWDPIGKK